MYIDQGNMILNMKRAQNFDVVKTVEKLTDTEITRALRDAIIAEEGAIKQYELFKDSIDDEKIKGVLQKLSNEEKVHVGELQKLLSDLLPDEQELLDKGAKEVEDETK